MSKTIRLLILLLAVVFISHSLPVTAGDRLSGRIVLQTEAQGQAWYINPLDGQRYLLSGPQNLTDLIKSFGLLVKTADLSAWQAGAPVDLSGRILVDETNKNQAYYVMPDSLQLYNLSNAVDAFNGLRSAALAVSNADLLKIKNSSARASSTIAVNGPAGVNSQVGIFSWHYKNKLYQLTLEFSEDLYQLYQGSPHAYQLNGALPADWQNAYYGIFLQTKSQDKIFGSMANQLQKQAAANHLSDDETAELAMAFVQSLPYDFPKATDKQAQVNYPYETLYKNAGICSDKALLAMVLLKQLGYGTAFLSYPDRDHAAVGIQCPSAYALPNTQYCFVETTDFFPLGFVPQDFTDASVAVRAKPAGGLTRFDKVFDTAVLGNQVVYQASVGKIYQNIAGTYQQIGQLKNDARILDATKPELEATKAQINNAATQVTIISSQLQDYQARHDYTAYNKLIPDYNNLAGHYNDLVNSYKVKIDSYNNTVSLYEKAINALYIAGK